MSQRTTTHEETKMTYYFPSIEDDAEAEAAAYDREMRETADLRVEWKELRLQITDPFFALLLKKLTSDLKADFGSPDDHVDLIKDIVRRQAEYFGVRAAKAA